MGEYVMNVAVPIKKGDIVAVDIEMFGQHKDRLHHPEGTLACVQIAIEGNPVNYVLTNHTLIEKALAKFHICKYVCGHNLLYDIRQLRRWFSFDPMFNIWDTMLMEQNLFAGYYASFGLDDLVRRWLRRYMDKQVRETFATSTTLTQEQLMYAVEDVVATLQIRQKQEEYIQQNALDLRSYWEIDMPMIWVVLDMQPAKVDRAGWLKMTDEFAAIGELLETQLGLNSKSTRQVKNKIKSALGIELQDTRKETMAEYDDELFSDIMDARSYRDSVSKYGYKWIKDNVDPDDYVRANWMICRAETSRPACSKPNLQNIPTRKTKAFREKFIQSKGMITVSDISQQEPRILADISNDPKFRDIFITGKDIHLQVASAAYREEITDKHDVRRNTGKTIGLGTSYGLTPKGLMKKIKVPDEKDPNKQRFLTEKEAQEFLNNYFRAFPGIQTWVRKQHERAARYGYVETAIGRRLHINPYGQSAMNNAINAPCQGGAADLTKKWCIAIWQEYRKLNKPFPLIMMVHDEVIFDHPQEDAEFLRKLLHKTIQQVGQELYPSVPFEAEVFQGENWSCKQ